MRKNEEGKERERKIERLKDEKTKRQKHRKKKDRNKERKRENVLNSFSGCQVTGSTTRQYNYSHSAQRRKKQGTR
jgi:hypothetical protein